MKLKLRAKRFLVVGAVGVAGVVVGVAGVRAAGIPATETVAYSGVLLNGGVPVTAATNLAVELFATDTGGAAQCTTSAQGLVPDATGHFRIPLSNSCVDVLRDNPDEFVGLQVNGSSLLPRTRISAVPYAVNAENAVTAAVAAAASDSVPGSALRTELDNLGLNVQGLNDSVATLNGQVAAFGSVVDTLEPSGVRLLTAHLRLSASPAGCTVVDQSGTWITSASRAAAGQCSLAFGGFAAPPTSCFVTADAQSENRCADLHLTASNMDVRLYTCNTFSPLDEDIYLLCTGRR